MILDSYQVKLTTTAVVGAFPEDTVLVAVRIAAALVAGTVSVTEMDTGAAAHLLDTFLAVYTPPGKAEMADMVVAVVAAVAGSRAAAVAGSSCLRHRRCPGQATLLEEAGPENPILRKLRLQAKTRSMNQ